LKVEPKTKTEILKRRQERKLRDREGRGAVREIAMVEDEIYH